MDLPNQHLSGNVICPMCSARIHGTKRYFVDWNSKKHEFTVVLAYHCLPCGIRFHEESIKVLPVDIAQKSKCSCGANLSLSDYSLRLSDDEIEFKGVYNCESCSKQKRSLIGRLRALAHRIFYSKTA